MLLLNLFMQCLFCKHVYDDSGPNSHELGLLAAVLAIGDSLHPKAALSTPD
jgi:hypothetical protein